MQNLTKYATTATLPLIRRPVEFTISIQKKHFLIFDIKTQIRRVLVAHAFEMMHFDLAENGYGPDSYMMNVKNRSNLILTLTLNTDGVCLYRTKTNDTWPFFPCLQRAANKEKICC